MKNIIIWFSLIFAFVNANAQEQATNTGNLQLHSNAKITFFGSFANNGSYIDGGLTTAFNGNAMQYVLGSSITTFHELEINNSEGVTMMQSAIVSDVLNLKSGALDLNSYQLVINNNLPTSIIRNSGYILSEKSDNSSTVKWNIGSELGSHIIPFGTVGGTYIPFELNLTSGNIGNATVATYPTAPDNIPFPTVPDNITNVNDIYGNDNSANTVDRFWMIEKDGLDGIATITFSFKSSEAIGITDFVAQRWSNAIGGWDTPLPSQTSTTNSATVPNVTKYSIWTLSGNSSPLPIEMLNFYVTKKDNYAELIWSTASEANNAGFDIEKSIDLKNWNKIDFVAGAGNSNKLIQYNYKDLLTENIKNNNSIIYYRFKQIDYNGMFKYSDIRFVNLNFENQEKINFTIYPNPAIDVIKINSNQTDQQFKVSIYNQFGALIYKYTLDGSLQIDVSQFYPACYQIIISSNEYQYHYKFVKIWDK